MQRTIFLRYRSLLLQRLNKVGTQFYFLQPLKRLVLREFCTLRGVLHRVMFQITCHAVFKKIAGQFAGQITQYCRTSSWLNTSVYLVSYDGLLVKTTTQKLPLCLFICVLLLKKIKNLADHVPAFGLLSLFSLVKCFFCSCLICQLWNPGLFIWSAIFDVDTWHTLMIWPFAPKWRWHNEGRWELALHASSVSLNYVIIPHPFELEYWLALRAVINMRKKFMPK